MWWRKVIELEPKSVKAHNNLGLAYFNRGLIEQAKKEWMRVLELHPGHPQAKKNLELLEK